MNQALEEAVSPGGIKYSYVYDAFTYGFFITANFCYLPRSFLYLFFVLGGLKIKRMHWYMQAKSYSFFVLCLLGMTTLVIIFASSFMLTQTLGTSVAYVLALFMIPITLLVAIDLYLCITTKQCLEERIWMAQPKVTHKHKNLNEDDQEDPNETKTEIIETKNSLKY